MGPRATLQGRLEVLTEPSHQVLSHSAWKPAQPHVRPANLDNLPSTICHLVAPEESAGMPNGLP